MKSLLLVLLLFVSPCLYGKELIDKKISNELFGYVKLFPEKASVIGDNWVLKIDDYAVSKKEYEDAAQEAYKAYCQQYELLPEEKKAIVPVPNEKDFRKLYIEEVIKQNIITLKAFSDSEFTNKVSASMLAMILRQALVQLYVQSKMPEPSSFYPTKEEIELYYKQNEEQFDRTGASAAQIKEYITQQLAHQKLQLWQDEFLKYAKENYKITRNHDYLGTNSALELVTNTNAAETH